jgi:hypothetical protein
MDKTATNKLAETILVAADKREKSWRGRFGVYALTHEQAFLEACKEVGCDVRLCTIASLLMSLAWNDTLDWATTVKEEK